MDKIEELEKRIVDFKNIKEYCLFYYNLNNCDNVDLCEISIVNIEKDFINYKILSCNLAYTMPTRYIFCEFPTIEMEIEYNKSIMATYK